MLFHRAWLGMRDSNPRMLGPEPSALPLGESPILGLARELTRNFPSTHSLYHTVLQK